ncbi:MAG: histone deacetylase [Anaerolineales bacterium]|nr:MAG: histone deacetylase [Anaerolineales bacterium]
MSPTWPTRRWTGEEASAVSVGYVYHPIFLEHDTGDHPENSSRLVAIMDNLGQVGLLRRLTAIAAERATFEDVARIHAPALFEHVRHVAERGGGSLDLDTVVCAQSFEAALYAAGGTIAATRAVLDAEVESAYALVRPPGHHATRTRAMGFCLFNNVALSAAWALDSGRASRIAIIDFDVHHGNGTAEAFDADPRVLYVSLHQYPLYPGTGHWREKGSGAGEGTCLNIPLPPGTGDKGYRQAFQRLVEPAVRRFSPGLILVSAGYDGHWADPLSWMLVSISGYRHMVDSLVSLARELCQGRLVVVLEGGYHLAALSHGSATTFAAMLDEPYDDCLGASQGQEQPIDRLLATIAHWHGIE